MLQRIRSGSKQQGWPEVSYPAIYRHLTRTPLGCSYTGVLLLPCQNRNSSSILSHPPSPRLQTRHLVSGNWTPTEDTGYKTTGKPIQDYSERYAAFGQQEALHKRNHSLALCPPRAHNGKRCRRHTSKQAQGKTPCWGK